MTDRDTWRIPPPLHEKTLFFHLTIVEWLIVALIFLVTIGIVISVGSIEALTYLAVPAVLFALFRRNDTSAGYVSGLEMMARYLRYFYQYAVGSDTFLLERSLPYEHGKLERSLPYEHGKEEKDPGDLE